MVYEDSDAFAAAAKAFAAASPELSSLHTLAVCAGRLKSSDILPHKYT
jgi:hypothetical protein